MRIFTGFCFILLIQSINPLVTQAQQIDFDKVGQYFQEAKEISELDEGKLWGMKIYGPLLFVFPELKEGVANFPVPISGWTEKNGLYHGPLSEQFGYSNTAFRWEGEEWSMVIFDHLSDDEFGRKALMMHELWHQHEDSIGIVEPYDKAMHLDKKEGRLLLYLEWHALMKALDQKLEDQNKFLSDALKFRRLREEMYPETYAHERARDLHEGMAEYTGMVMSGMTDSLKKEFLYQKILANEAGNTLVWTYAYITGPFYGYFMDQRQDGWTRSLTSDSDLGDLLAATGHFDESALNLDQLHAVGQPYGYDSLFYNESERIKMVEAVQASFKERFVDGHTLFFPQSRLQIQFNPQKITPMEGVGTVYGILSAQSDWGTLEIKEDGILLLEGWAGLVLDVKADWDPSKDMICERYQINLNEQYHIVQKDQGWIVTKKEE